MWNAGEELFCVGCTDAAAATSQGPPSTTAPVSRSSPGGTNRHQGEEPTTFTVEDGTHWFETETSETPLSIGADFTLPVATEGQSVWVANSNGEYGVTGGKAEPDFDNGQYHPNNNYWMLFDVPRRLLETVDVYSGGGGMQTIEILNGSGALVHSVSQVLEAGLNVFTVDAELQAGANYGIRSGTDEPLLWREDSGAEVNYPYEVGNLASITSTTINGDNQYTFTISTTTGRCPPSRLASRRAWSSPSSSRRSMASVSCPPPRTASSSRPSM